MDLERLKNLLSDQDSNIANLLEVALKKQRAVITNDREELEKLNFNEETLLNRVNAIEIERVNFLNNIPSTAEGQRENISGNLMELFLENNREKIDDKTYKDITDYSCKLKDKVTQLQNINGQNRFLIEQANNLLKQLLKEILKSQKKPILDRKI